MKTRLPEFLRPCFWDVNFSNLTVEGNSEYIINRLLDKGNLEAVLWVRQAYPAELVRKVLTTYRDFSLKSASFWGLIYDVPKSEIKCFQEPYHTMRKMLWPY